MGTLFNLSLDIQIFAQIPRTMATEQLTELPNSVCRKECKCVFLHADKTGNEL